MKGTYHLSDTAENHVPRGPKKLDDSKHGQRLRQLYCRSCCPNWTLSSQDGEPVARRHAVAGAAFPRMVTESARAHRYSSGEQVL